MRIIDNWFSKYGYKVNKLKIPEISSRTNWNYVQIGSQDIIGIPSITKNSVLYTTPGKLSFPVRLKMPYRWRSF